MQTGYGFSNSGRPRPGRSTWTRWTDVDTKGWAGLSVQIHPQTHSPSLPEIQHIPVPIKQGGDGLGRRERPGRVGVSVEPPSERKDPRHRPWRGRPCGRMDEAGPPTRHPAVKGGGALGPLRALLTGRVSEVRGQAPSPAPRRREVATGELSGGVGASAHSGGVSPLIVLLCFPWSGPWRSLAAEPSRAAGQGRGKDGRTDNERT